ncbi:uncharacterized protein BDW43DRAFT_321716 [Aspergillus alliaceus]|uniref:uncharacterized protein n=1 Tax=Petromyces alliaceus TaxID=209559 RepID=UPI0012A41DB9|nr:uncharacterized protein BDW43DRAFT_321716 [Aspergillus alliaceus]KAB8230015.1 hypothetical protein BDW43DRAFT_321716 [Aspergillus alliaceus]
MHLNHKLPWNTVSSHFTFIKENPCKNRETDFIIHDRFIDRQSAELNYFTRTLISTIEEFATTERTKYPPATELPTSGPLFDTSLLTAVEQKYHLEPHRTNSAVSNPLCEKFQSVDYWSSEAPYNTSDGELADAVKMLLISNQMLALLRLANHDKIPLETLDHLTWGHSFGFNHVADVALQAYLLLNIAAAVKANAKPGSANDTVRLTDTQWFRSFTNWALGDFDYSAQNIPHRFFWNTREITAAQCSSWDPLSLGTREEREEMKVYLKVCFELLYRYDLLMRELKRDPGWTGRILGILRLWGARSVTMDESGFCFT